MNLKVNPVSRLRWKRNPAETGLRRVGAAPRGWTLHDGVDEYASVSPNGGAWSKPQNGWFWVAYSRNGLDYFNSYKTPVDTPEEAKATAMAYVKACLFSGDKK